MYVVYEFLLHHIFFSLWTFELIEHPKKKKLHFFTRFLFIIFLCYRSL